MDRNNFKARMALDQVESSKAIKEHAATPNTEPAMSESSISSTHHRQLLVKGHIPDIDDKKIKQHFDPGHFGNVAYDFDDNGFYYLPQHVMLMDIDSPTLAPTNDDVSSNRR